MLLRLLYTGSMVISRVSTTVLVAHAELFEVMFKCVSLHSFEVVFFDAFALFTVTLNNICLKPLRTQCVASSLESGKFRNFGFIASYASQYTNLVSS